MRAAAKKARVDADAAYAREVAEDDAASGGQSTLSDTELDGMESVTEKLQADALAKAKRLKRTKVASARQTGEHEGSQQRRRPREQVHTDTAAERNGEDRRGDRTPSRERRARPGGQAARRPDGRAPRRNRHDSTPTLTEDEASDNEDYNFQAPEPRAKKAKKAKNR